MPLSYFTPLGARVVPGGLSLRVSIFQSFLSVRIAVAPGLIPFLTPSPISAASPAVGSRGLMNTGPASEVPTLRPGLSQNIEVLPGCGCPSL